MTLFVTTKMWLCSNMLDAYFVLFTPELIVVDETFVEKPALYPISIEKIRKRFLFC